MHSLRALSNIVGVPLLDTSSQWEILPPHFRGDPYQGHLS